MVKKISKIMYIAAAGLLTYASYLFIKFNMPIIKNDILLYITLNLNLIGFIALLLIKKRITDKRILVLNFSLSLGVSAFLVYSLLTSVLIDYFQPLSLYDQIIYPALAGFVILMVFILINGAAGVISKEISLQAILTSFLVLFFLLQFYGLGTLQKNFEYTNTTGETAVVFDSGESGYKIFRIPSLLVVPEGSLLADGTNLDDDLVIAMAEGRRKGSPDHGDIDLVQKISYDRGSTWSRLMIISTYEPGIGKTGNSTPVFDSASGEISLLHISGDKPKNYRTYNKISGDGGLTWSDPVYVYDGIVGPGHGIMIENGPHSGRLVVPGYHEGGSLSLFSDDHGNTWQTSEKLNGGSECEIAEINNRGDLMMVVRTDKGVSLPHGPLEKLYATSEDGGATWSELKIMDGIKEPICMSSIVRSGDALYYSHPDDYYSRSQMTVAASYDEGKTFSDKKLIYQGPAGYSELGVLTGGDLLLLFEGGAIEYDEQIRFVKISE